MKKYLIFTAVLIISAIQPGCRKDEKLTHLTDFDLRVITAVNNFREDNGLPRIIHQYLMADDAKTYSGKMAKGESAYGTEGVMPGLIVLQNNLDGDTCAAVVQESEINNADTVVNRMIRNPQKRMVLLGNFNQTSVGSAMNSEGKWYITQLFIHIPNK